MKRFVKTLLKNGRNFVFNILSNKGVFSAKGLQVSLTRSLLKDCEFCVSGKNNKIIIGNGCSLKGVRFFMTGDNNTIHIGERVIVNASGKQPTLFNACGGASIIVEDDCLFSNSIEIHTTDYHKILTNGMQTNFPADVIIKKHTWIGLRTIVLKGSVIPQNCIVGACSLVNKSFQEESNVIIAGNPAKVLKKDVDWCL